MRLALRTYEQLGMIEAVDGVYVISDWDRIVDEERLRRLEARREAKRLEAAQPKKSREQVVHEYVAAHPDASQVQIARETGVPRSSAHPDASQVQIARETGVPRSSVQRYLKTYRGLPAQGDAQAGVPTPAQKGAHLGAQMGCPPLPMGTQPGTPVGTPETLENTGLREGAQNSGKDEELDIDIDNTSTAGDEKNGHPSKRAGSSTGSSGTDGPRRQASRWTTGGAWPEHGQSTKCPRRPHLPRRMPEARCPRWSRS